MQRVGSIAAAIGGALVVVSSLAAVAAFFMPAMLAIRDAMTLAILAGYVIAFAALAIAAVAISIDFFHLTRKREPVPIQRLIRLVWVVSIMSIGALGENIFMSTRLLGADPWSTVVIAALGICMLLIAIGLALLYFKKAIGERSP